MRFDEWCGVHGVVMCVVMCVAMCVVMAGCMVSFKYVVGVLHIQSVLCSKESNVL